MKNNKPDAALLWKQIDDDLVPRLGLNLTERIVYASLLRYSRLEGKRQLRFTIPCFSRSVRLSEWSTREAVRSLAGKGALRLLDRSHAGHLAEIFLPDEIQDQPLDGPVPLCLARGKRTADHDEKDFVKVSSRREAIHVREGGRCFYCLQRVVVRGVRGGRGRVLDHVVPRARGGTNSCRNLVSCCVECNSQKGEMAAEDFLRSLFRHRRITSIELEGQLRALDALAAGKLRPVLLLPAVATRNQRKS